MMRTEKNDANRRVDGEQREIEFERGHIEDGGTQDHMPLRTCETRATMS